MKVLTLVFLTASLVPAQKITVEFDQGVDFSRFHTFALHDGQLNSRNPALNSELIRKRLDDSIVRYSLSRVARHRS